MKGEFSCANSRMSFMEMKCAWIHLERYLEEMFSTFSGTKNN